MNKCPRCKVMPFNRWHPISLYWWGLCWVTRPFNFFTPVVFASVVLYHNPPLPGVPIYALPVLNHYRNGHETDGALAHIKSSVIQLILHDVDLITTLVNKMSTVTYIVFVRFYELRVLYKIIVKRKRTEYRKRQISTHNKIKQQNKTKQKTKRKQKKKKNKQKTNKTKQRKRKKKRKEQKRKEKKRKEKKRKEKKRKEKERIEKKRKEKKRKHINLCQ